jgi:hypothetical protein
LTANDLAWSDYQRDMGKIPENDELALTVLVVIHHIIWIVKAFQWNDNQVAGKELFRSPPSNALGFQHIR